MATMTATPSALAVAFESAGFAAPTATDEQELAGAVALAQELIRSAGAQNRALIAVLAEYAETSNWQAASERILADFAAELEAAGYRGKDVRKSELKKVLATYGAFADFRALLQGLLATSSMGLQGAYKTAIKFARAAEKLAAAGADEGTLTDDEGADVTVDVPADDAEPAERTLAQVNAELRAALKVAHALAQESLRDDVVIAIAAVLAVV